MYRSGYRILILVITMLAFSGAESVYGQSSNNGTTQRSYKVYLHFVSGGESSPGSVRLPKSIRSAFDDLRDELVFNDYRLVSTHFQRFSTGGQIQSQAILKKLGGFGLENWPIIMNWSLGAIENTNEAPGRVGFRRFTFGARIPFVTGEKISYEAIQYSLGRIDIKEGTPTVIGSLSIPQSNEMLFFVVSAKSED